MALRPRAGHNHKALPVVRKDHPLESEDAVRLDSPPLKLKRTLQKFKRKFRNGNASFPNTKPQRKKRLENKKRLTRLSHSLRIDNIQERSVMHWRPLEFQSLQDTMRTTSFHQVGAGLQVTELELCWNGKAFTSTTPKMACHFRQPHWIQPPFPKDFRGTKQFTPGGTTRHCCLVETTD